jgi:hypothetical protein
LLKLHVIQAEHGDCLIIEYGSSSKPRYILVDGGPETIYNDHLRDQLKKTGTKSGNLDLVISSHIDEDHIIGLVDFLAELRQQRAEALPEIVTVNAVWHNSFSKTIGEGNDMEARLKTLETKSAINNMMSFTAGAVKGIAEGSQLRSAANELGIPLNPGFPNDLVCVDDAPDTISYGNLNLHIVGPTKKSLENLREEWLKWFSRYKDIRLTASPSVSAMIDQSVPNLSSVMVLAEADGKKILLTGDGRGDHLLQGLRQANIISPKENLHVDVLKVSHHGSNRNATRELFKTIIADKYIISANGKYGNPDLATLIWIVEAAKEQGRTVEIFVTNETASTRKLVEEYNPKDYGYKLTKLKKRQHAAVFKIA